MTDLILTKGDPLELPYPTGGYKKIFALNGYCRAHVKTKSCKTCLWRRRIRYHDKTYNKCARVGDSRCSATDIKLCNTCRLWETA